ncbi:MAG TPA: methyl-accepting chemotaxis protein [Anaerolineae bacterium]|nr:methyl-accepting chemotaxis protein [Anaerolineae bacterium]
MNNSTHNTQLSFIKTMRAKLMLWFFLVSFIPLTIVMSIAFFSARDTLQNQVENAMSNIREVQAEQITDYLHEQEADLTVLATSPSTLESIVEFNTGFKEVGSDTLRTLYLNNATGIGINNNNTYVQNHRDHHRYFQNYVDVYGYYDVFLINPQGDIIYSVLKEDDFGTNLLNGPYSDSNLAKGFRQVLAGNQQSVLVDYAFYEPSGGEVAAFILTLVRDGDDILGVAAFQIPINIINNIMHSGTGLGQTGESYLVGSDNLMRTNSRFTANNILRTTVDTPSVQAALAGESGQMQITDYRGVDTLSAYEPLAIGNLNWAVITEIDTAEAFAPIDQLLRLMLTIAVVAIFGVAGFAYVMAGQLSNPIRAITTAATKVAAGDLSQSVTVNSQDETGLLANAFNTMTSNLRHRMAAEQAASQQASELAEAERTQKEYLENTVEKYLRFIERVGTGDLTARLSLNGRTDAGRTDAGRTDALTTLGHNLNNMVENLSDMTRQIREATNNLSAAAAEIMAATTQQASGAAEQSSAISQTTTTIDEVKAIAEQSFTKAQQVAQQAQQTRTVSTTGRQAIDETIGSMTQIKEKVAGIAENILALSEQTQQIGEIITTVNDIASQSNLLALNASVEAARAGEHGKGFNVVAVEVRNLAEQSKQATAQVKSILDEIQRATNVAVMVTEEGTKGVDQGVVQTERAGDTIKQLAQSVNESASAAQQIVASSQQQTTGMEQIALAMQNINQATMQSLASTRQAEKATQDLSSLAKQMESLISRYKVD